MAANEVGNGHDTAALDRLAGLEADRDEAHAEGPSPGQLDIDGGEVAAPLAGERVAHGTAPLDLFNAGGKLPNRATLTVKAIKVGLEPGTAFRKGDALYLEGYATVVSAMPKDRRDKDTGVVLECELLLTAEVDEVVVRDVP